MRNNATPAEKKLWEHLRHRQFLGYKFRRQQGIGPYSADFYCPDARLVIELDGGVHFTREALEYDHHRNLFLHSNGMAALRFQNEEIFNDVDSVLHTIEERVRTTAPDASHHPLLNEKGNT